LAFPRRLALRALDLNRNDRPPQTLCAHFTDHLISLLVLLVNTVEGWSLVRYLYSVLI
jgi:hypothetical protein